MRNLRIAELLFNRPLMITESKLNVILGVLGPRFNLDVSGLPSVQAAQISDQERRRAGYSATNGIGLISIHGPLMHRVMASDYPSGGPTTYADIRRAFDLALVDDGVEGIVLDLDSPGGEVHGAFDLADHIQQSRGTKPITAVVNESAYSAAYLIASAADRIVVPRTGGVGSIGVIATHADFSRAEDAAGITVTHVYSGARKADFSPHAPLAAEAMAQLQASVEETYRMFVDTVARNRGLSAEAVRGTEAGIYEGEKAVTAGLADEVAPVNRAVASARTRKRTATGKALSTTKENRSMTIEELKNEHPDLVAAIEADARSGMISQTEATAATTVAVAAEQERVTSLASACFGEEQGRRFAAVSAKGLTATDLADLGIRFEPPETSAAAGDAESRAAILNALHQAAPEGLKGAQPVAGAVAEKAAAVNVIAAAGSAKR